MPSQSQSQCFAGVMNLKAGTLTPVTLAPVTLADLSRPARVKATTASIPVAPPPPTDAAVESNHAPAGGRMPPLRV